MPLVAGPAGPAFFFFIRSSNALDGRARVSPIRRTLQIPLVHHQTESDNGCIRRAFRTADGFLPERLQGAATS